MSLLDEYLKKLKPIGNAVNSTLSGLGNAANSAIQNFYGGSNQIGNYVGQTYPAKLGTNVGQALGALTPAGQQAINPYQGAAQKQLDMLLQQAHNTQDKQKKQKLLSLYDTQNKSLGKSSQDFMAKSGANTKPLKVLENAFGTLGTITTPLSSQAAGAGIGAGFQAAGNLVGGRPITNNLMGAASAGQNFSALLGPLSTIVGGTGISPLASKYAYKFLTPKLGAGLASSLGSNIAGNVLKESAVGGLYGGLTGQNPLKTAAGFAPFGLLPAAMEFHQAGKSNFVNKGLHPEDVTFINDLYNKAKSGNLKPEEFGNAEKIVNLLAERHLDTKTNLKGVLPSMGQKLEALYNLGQYDTMANTGFQGAQNLTQTDKKFTVDELTKGNIAKEIKRYQTPEAPLSTKVVDQKLNTDNLNLTEKEAKIATNMQRKLGLTTRNVRSFDQMKAMANELGTDPKALLADIKSGRITDKEVVALGDVINSTTQRISTLSKKLKASPNDTNLQAQLSAEENTLSSALGKRITGGTEAGRAVVAFRIIANRNLEPAYWLAKAQKQVGDKNIPTEAVTAINGLIEKKDRLGLANFISTLGESSGWEKAIGLWKAGLLTSPKTHLGNIGSNTTMGLLENIKDIPATAFDMARSAITGGPRAKTLSLRQITDQAGGAKRGLDYAREYMKTGIDPLEAGKFDMPKKLRFGNSVGGRVAQKYVDTVFGTLGAEDKIFREAAFSKSVAEQAAVKGINEKLTQAQVDNLIKNPSTDIIEIAKKDAAQATFNGDNKLSDAIKGAKRAGGEPFAAVVDFVAPFTRTPTNVAKAVVDYSPAGLAMTVAKKIFNRQSVSDKELAEAFGRSATGTAVAWLGYQMSKRGLVSGTAPASAAERAQMEIEGRPANAILINGKWRQVSRISPFGNLILLGDAFNKSGGSVSQTALTGAKQLTEQTFLKGAGQALDAVNNPQQNAQSYLNSAVSGTVPSLVGGIATGTDPFQRKSEGIGQAVQARIPGLRENLPVKLDSLGRPMKNEGGIVGSLVDPFNSKTASSDPVVNELTRVGFDLNRVGERLSNQPLSREMADQYQQLAGQHVKELLTPLFASKAYQTADLETQQNLVEKTVNAAKGLAQKEIKVQLPVTEPGSTSQKKVINQLPIIAKPASAAEVTTPTTGDSAVSKIQSKLQLDLEKEKLKLSDAPYSEVGDTLLYKDGDTIRTIDKNTTVNKPDLSKGLQLSEAAVSQFNSDVSGKSKDIYTLYKLGKMTEKEAERQLTDLAALKKDIAKKISDMRPKKGKKISLKGLKIKSPKIIKLSKPKIRIAKPKFRQSSFRLTPAASTSKLRLT